MKKTFYPVVIALITYSCLGISYASDGKQNEHQAVEQHSGLQLSDDLKVILNEEMNGIEGGMMKIIPAMAAGDWETIAVTATKIKDSFILKQKLTQPQLEELHGSLPPGFIEIDLSFHSTSEKLAHAARQHDAELVNFYFSSLQSKCITCHSKYAAGRFPGLKSSQGKSDHQ